MKRPVVLALFFFAFILSSTFAYDARDEQASQLADDFTLNAMAEIKEINSSDLDYPQIDPMIREYANQMAKSFFASELDEQAVSRIMQKVSGPYGKAVAAILKGENYSDAIQDYTRNLSDLLSQEHLDIAAQSPVISLSNQDLEQINVLYKDINRSY